MYYKITPQTLALGDFHPSKCIFMILIMLRLSECVYLGTFMLLTDVIKEKHVSLLPSLIFLTGTCFS